MTEEQWNTLQAVSPVLESWHKNQFFRSVGVQEQKPRLEWLAKEFGMMPFDWTCRGCITSRLTSLYNIYDHERKQRTTI